LLIVIVIIIIIAIADMPVADVFTDTFANVFANADMTKLTVSQGSEM
jgi:hypothetical protein